MCKAGPGGCGSALAPPHPLNQGHRPREARLLLRTTLSVHFRKETDCVADRICSRSMPPGSLYTSIQLVRILCVYIASGKYLRRKKGFFKVKKTRSYFCPPVLLEATIPVPFGAVHAGLPSVRWSAGFLFPSLCPLCQGCPSVFAARGLCNCKETPGLPGTSFQQEIPPAAEAVATARGLGGVLSGSALSPWGGRAALPRQPVTPDPLLHSRDRLPGSRSLHPCGSTQAPPRGQAAAQLRRRETDLLTWATGGPYHDSALSPWRSEATRMSRLSRGFVLTRRSAWAAPHVCTKACASFCSVDIWPR